MKNLKKILALVLTMTMVLSIGVTASASKFKDEKEINQKEAVQLLTDLKVITGMPDGTFKPDDTVTRAEMATMLCKLVLGENFKNTATKGLTQGKLKDVATSWAEPQIGYCYTMGYITGFPDGTFKPEQKVNTVEASCMILKALGYNKENEFAKNWSITTMSTAYNSGILSDLNLVATAPLSRENAAKMMYNALWVQSKSHTDALGYMNNGTFANSVYGMEKVEGTVTAVTPEAVYVDGLKYSGLAADFTDIGTTVTFYGKFPKVPANTLLNTTVTVDLKHPIGAYSQTVTPVNNILATVTDGSSLSSVTTRNDKNYVASLSKDAVYYLNGEAVNKAAITDMGKGDVMKLIDNDNDGLIDVVSVSKYTVGKVSYIDTKNETVKIGANSYKMANVVGADNLKKGDLVYYYTYSDSIYPYVAEKISGKVTNYKSADNSYVINGTTHYIAARNVGVSMNVGATYDFYVDANGYILVSDVVNVAAEYLYAIDNDSYDIKTKLTNAVVTFADGSTSDIVVTSVGTGTNSHRIYAGSLSKNVYSYERDASGHYALYPVSTLDNWSKFSAGTVTNGGLTANLGISVPVDGNTLWVDTTTGKTYTGFNAVPSMVNVSGWYNLDAKGYVSIVFIGERDTTLAADKFTIVNTNYEQDFTHGNTYIYNAVVDGVIKPVKVNSTVHTLIQNNGAGIYTITASANGVVTAATAASMSSAWDSVTVDRAGIIQTSNSKQLLQKSENTVYAIYDVTNGKAVTCDSYEHILAELGVNSLAGQMAVITTDITGRIAETVFVVANYPFDVPTISFDGAKVGTEKETIYAPANTELKMIVSTVPGAVVTYKNTSIAAGTDGKAIFKLPMTGTATMDCAVTARLGNKTLSAVKTLNFVAVSKVTISGDMASATTLKGAMHTFDGVTYVENGSDLSYTVNVTGSYKTYRGAESFQPAGLTVNGETFKFDTPTAGLIVSKNADAKTFTATLTKTLSAVAADVTIDANKIAGEELAIPEYYACYWVGSNKGNVQIMLRYVKDYTDASGVEHKAGEWLSQEDLKAMNIPASSYHITVNGTSHVAKNVIGFMVASSSNTGNSEMYGHGFAKVAFGPDIFLNGMTNDTVTFNLWIDGLNITSVEGTINVPAA